MNILIVTPARPGSHKGNRVTAQRWSRILRSLDHRVAIKERFEGGRYDLLIALHARRSASSVRRFARARPDARVVVALTGTDLYRDLRRSVAAHRSLAAADRLIVLQPKAVETLPASVRAKTRVVLQSATAPAVVRRCRSGRKPSTAGPFTVCVLGHLRPVKDPFRAAYAVRLLPKGSTVRVVHVGAALTAAMENRARAETETNPRYRWLGDRPRGRALGVLARSRLLVISSKLEGGANVLSESIAASVPVVSSRIDGSVGILGEDYPGYFTVGDTRGLAELLRRCETDDRFRRRLAAWCHRLAPRFEPARETRAWARILDELHRGRA